METGPCPQITNTSLSTPIPTHCSLEGRPVATRDSSFSRMPGFTLPNPPTEPLEAEVCRRISNHLVPPRVGSSLCLVSSLLSS